MINESGLITSGKILNTFGIKGEVKLLPWADSPEFLTGFKRIYIDGKPVEILSARVQKGCVIAALKNVDNIDAAIKLKGKEFKINKSDIKLEEGRFFVAELIGLKALNAETGDDLGIIEDVLSLPAHNVYIIKGKREILVPAVSEFIIESDLNAGFVKIRLIEGM